MKRILTTLLAASLMLLGTQAFAQVSVNAGYINSTRATKGAESANANGAYAGLSFNIPIAGGFGIAPGVYYSMLTSKDVANMGAGYSGTGSFMEHAINAPVHLNVSFGARDTKFFIYGGPTFQYGLASKSKSEEKFIISNGSMVSVGGEKDGYKDLDNSRFVIYAGGGVGLNAGGIMVTVGYDYGITNLDKSGNSNSHRSNLKIGVGFEF